MNVKESTKERLFNQLQICLDALGSYDINSLMPLLYVVVAHYEGHLVSIIGKSGNLFVGKMHIQPVEAVDGYESDLLKSIRKSVNEYYFEGQSAEAVFRFYESCNGYIKDNFHDIIEYIISHYSSRAGKYSGMSITPQELAKLMAGILATLNPKGIYDPCAGLCSYSMAPELVNVPFWGQEINPFTQVIADVRLYAAKRELAEIRCNDCTSNWDDAENRDCLASELPFGLRLNDITNDKLRPKLLEDYIIYKFINSSSLKKAVLLVSMGTCFRRENFDLRKTLCEKNWIDSVIKLPAGILPYAGINTAILVLNKEHDKKEVRFVLADDCILNSERKRILDYQGVLDRLSGVDEKQSDMVNVKMTYEHDCSLDPSAYIQERIEVLPGQKIIKFSSLATRERGVRHFEETRGRVLQPEHMCGSITEMHTRSISIEEVELTRSAYIKICSKVIIFNVRADKFFIKNDEESLFVSPNYNCFIIQEDKCMPEYLADCVINAKKFRESALMGQGMPRIDWENLLLPIYDDLESQNQIIQRIYRQEQNELKKKLESLQILSGKSSDLIHNLGVTFTKIGAAIGVLRNSEDNDTVNSMYDNVQFALRLINSTGTDFKYVHPEMEKVNLFEQISKYVNAWKNFGFQSFVILPVKNDMSEDTIVEIDITLFYTMLDCILINAHQHGFNKRYSPDNKVMVVIEGVEYNSKKFVRIGVSNNGNPLPDEFSLQDFVSRGVVGTNSFQDGVGGDHIKKIVEKFGGLLSIESEPEWLTFNILLPVYLTSNNTKFSTYEYECI